MFYFGDVPWHGKGTKINEPANATESLKFGELGREVELISIVTKENPPSPVTCRMAVVRKDRAPGDPSRVIGVAHPGFRPLQNRDGIDLIDDLLGHGKHIYHTGGYLGNGEVIWLLARLPKDIKVRGKDVVEPYMLFTDSHDGSIAVDFRLTTIRVVCQNTLTLVLKPKNSNFVFKRSHQGSYKALEQGAQQFFQMCEDATKELDTRFQAMSNVGLDSNGLGLFIENLVPLLKLPTRAEKSSQVRRAYEQRLAKAQQVRAGIKQVFD
jgi:phage/plasmid-like protein (TIGR03299 family)